MQIQRPIEAAAVARRNEVSASLPGSDAAVSRPTPGAAGVAAGRKSSPVFSCDRLRSQLKNSKSPISEGVASITSEKRRWSPAGLFLVARFHRRGRQPQGAIEFINDHPQDKQEMKPRPHPRLHIGRCLFHHG